LISTGVGVAVVGLLLLLAVKVVIPLVRSVGSLVTKPFTTISVLRDPSKSLQKTNNRTNILVLGRGGAFHEASDLTDTIIVVSLDHSSNQVSMISLPRDIWIDSMRAKINTAYHYGQQKNPEGGGFVLARDAVFQVTDLPIHYTAVVDFEGFKQAIDLVGGVEVEVERSFTDEKYPVENNEPFEDNEQ
jgi:LCP family protein required for cell wall assembly